VPADADADEARRAAEEILSGPEYREPAESWITRALDWLDEAFSRIFGTLGGTGGSSVVGWVILVLALVGVGVVVFFAVRSLRRGGRGAREDDAADAAPRRRRRDAVVDWDAEAAKLEAEGRWRDGMRARYRALVAELSRAKVVDPATSRTTGEHRREVGDTVPDVGADFGDAAELFDRAWYGNRPTGPAEAEQFAELARRVEERST
jgi:hypothetical protein